MCDICLQSQKMIILCKICHSNSYCDNNNIKNTKKNV